MIESVYERVAESVCENVYGKCARTIGAGYENDGNCVREQSAQSVHEHELEEGKGE